MPAGGWGLAGGQGGAEGIAVLDDCGDVMPLLRPERLEGAIVEDQQRDAAEGAHQSRVAAIAASEREIAEHPRHALIENRAVVAAGLLTECASQPAFADTGRPFDDQVLCVLDPAAGDHRLE